MFSSPSVNIFYAAGFESSSSLMSFTLFELAKHPAIQRKVQNMIDTVFERYDSKIEYSVLQHEIPYMNQVISGLRPPSEFEHSNFDERCEWVSIAYMDNELLRIFSYIFQKHWGSIQQHQIWTEFAPLIIAYRIPTSLSKRVLKSVYLW